MGSNMAEAHPVGFQWVMEAKARGTQVVHIDPRFTRTSAVADKYVSLRAGTDIAFLGGVINYILSNELDFREYVTAYTNASFIVDENFQDTEDLDGLFSGYDDETASYDPSSWHYESTSPSGTAARTPRTTAHRISTDPVARRSRAVPMTSRTTRHCSTRAASIRSSSGTTPATPRTWWSGSAVCLPRSSCRSRRRGRRIPAASARPLWCTARDGLSTRWARSTSAPAAIIQLLLGNIGRPGGGVMALRGHASIQGSTDVSTLFDLLPGYLAMPKAGDGSLSEYLDRITGDAAEGLLAQRRCVHGLVAQGVLGRRMPPRTTTSASTTCRGSTATTARTAP